MQSVKPKRKYNVPAKTQISVLLLDEHFEIIKKLAEEKNISRAKLLSEILTKYFDEGLHEV